MPSHEFGPEFSRDYINIGETKQIEEVQISVIPNQEQSSEPQIHVREVDEHEAEHAVVAEKNKSGSVKGIKIFSEESAVTELTEPDPIAAATSINRPGNSHDRRVISSLGFNENSVAGIANNMVYKYDKEIKKVAQKLKEKNSLSGNELRNIMEEVSEKKREPDEKKFKANIVIADTNGGQRKIEGVPAAGGKVVFHREWVPITGKKPAAS